MENSEGHRPISHRSRPEALADLVDSAIGRPTRQAFLLPAPVNLVGSVPGQSRSATLNGVAPVEAAQRKDIAGDGTDACDRSEHCVWLVVDGFLMDVDDPAGFADSPARTRCRAMPTLHRAAPPQAG